MSVNYFENERANAQRAKNDSNKISGGSFNDISFVPNTYQSINPTNEMTNNPADDGTKQIGDIRHVDTSKCSCGFVYPMGETTDSITGGGLSVSKVCPMCSKTSQLKGGDIACPTGLRGRNDNYVIKSTNGPGQMILSTPELNYDGYEVDEVDRQKTFEMGKTLIDTIGQGGLPKSYIKKQANILMGAVNTSNKEITGAVYSNHNQYVNKRKQKKKAFNMGTTQEFGLRNIGGGHILASKKK